MLTCFVFFSLLDEMKTIHSLLPANCTSQAYVSVLIDITHFILESGQGKSAFPSHCRCGIPMSSDGAEVSSFTSLFKRPGFASQSSTIFLLSVRTRRFSPSFTRKIICLCLILKSTLFYYFFLLQATRVCGHILRMLQ